MKKFKRVDLHLDLHSERGIAVIEMIPIIALFTFLLCYTLGFFGAIHTGIMNSISARAYTWEIYRNRANLTYFRDTKGGDKNHFLNSGNRVQAIMNEDFGAAAAEGFRASTRPIRIGAAPEQLASDDVQVHNTKIFDGNLVGTGRQNSSVGVQPIWVQVHYGICLTARCGN